VRYQRRLIQALDSMAVPYGFTIVDATQPSEAIFSELQRQIAALSFEKVNGGARPARRAVRRKVE